MSEKPITTPLIGKNFQTTSGLHIEVIYAHQMKEEYLVVGHDHSHFWVNQYNLMGANYVAKN